MLKIILTREKEYKNIRKPNKSKIEGSTIGGLKIFDEKGENIFNCYTLENEGESTSESGKDKRISAGDYYLRWTSSRTNGSLSDIYHYWNKNRHPDKIKDGTQGKNIAVWVMSDKIKNHNKRRILMHIGNYPQDTEGCILLGYSNGGTGTIGDSIRCVNDLFLLFEKYGIENFILTIKEIETA
ncbi:DUF5675 family protein [uncultured Brachyspira sp.]|uniref:DUF5675 family protein n=1 Tax=uncultured Brachyspira sp. TaxID=221953 RepID=UPI0025FE17C2|nr:DUF5675 family protein [uncultured Brachyspira sp.]